MTKFFKNVISSVELKAEAPQKYEIPEKYKGFKVPENMDEFVKDILPSIYNALKRTPLDEKELVVGRFIIRMFQVTKSGKKRYQVYNPEKYSTIPYYKWFLSQVYYFELYHFSDKEEEKKVSSLTYINSKGETDDWQVAKAADPFDIAYTRQLPAYLKQYSTENYKEEKTQQRHFENYAYQLYEARVNGLQNQEFAAKIGVSGVTVSHWMRKLRVLVQNYFEGKYEVLSTI